MKITYPDGRVIEGSPEELKAAELLPTPATSPSPPLTSWTFNPSLAEKLNGLCLGPCNADCVYCRGGAYWSITPPACTCSCPRYVQTVRYSYGGVSAGSTSLLPFLTGTTVIPPDDKK